MDWPSTGSSWPSEISAPAMKMLCPWLIYWPNKEGRCGKERETDCWPQRIAGLLHLLGVVIFVWVSWAVTDDHYGHRYPQLSHPTAYKHSCPTPSPTVCRSLHTANIMNSCVLTAVRNLELPSTQYLSKPWLKETIFTQRFLKAVLSSHCPCSLTTSLGGDPRRQRALC